jgi:type VI secretion system protein ImpE
MNAGTLAMVHTYRGLLQCEVLRKAVFEGEKSPLVFGEPEQWIALVFEALRMDGAGERGQARELRAEAFESAPTVSGRLNDASFDWIADADSRIGPFLEAVVNGKYYWIPMHRIAEIRFDDPEDLRDFVWTPAQFQWANGGEAVGFIPTRYVGTELETDSLLRLSRKTEWLELAEGMYAGLGQRILVTSSDEYSLLDVRSISILGSSETA